jgi:hypothetical protein
MLTLEPLAAQAWRLYRAIDASGASFLVRPSIPILFFGDSKQYFASPLRVITVGLNPSRSEFPDDDRFARFSASRDLPPRGFENVDGFNNYIGSMNDYFRVRPYSGWFRPAFEDLLRGMDASYYDGAGSTALHTDLGSPLATDPTWSKLGSRRGFLATDGIALWHDLVAFLEPDVIVVSVAREHLANIRFPLNGGWRVAHTVERTNPYSVEAARVELPSGKHSLLVFGRAANLPFGTVSAKDKGLIGAALLETYAER